MGRASHRGRVSQRGINPRGPLVVGRPPVEAGQAPIDCLLRHGDVRRDNGDTDNQRCDHLRGDDVSLDRGHKPTSGRDFCADFIAYTA